MAVGVVAAVAPDGPARAHRLQRLLQLESLERASVSEEALRPREAELEVDDAEVFEALFAKVCLSPVRGW